MDSINVDIPELSYFYKMNFDITPALDLEVLAIQQSLVSNSYNTQEEKEFFAANIIVKRVKKGELLLKQDQILKASFHLFKGCVREYYFRNGEEKTSNFYTVGESMYDGWINEGTVRSTLNWECISDGIISVLTFEVEKEMFKRFPRLESLCRIETEKQYSNYKNAANEFFASAPEERYETFMKTKPEIFQLVPLYQIASYLGVKPESLSRIRNRLRSASKVK